MKHLHLENPRSYDGSELRPRFIYETTGLLGDAILSFTGPCEVNATHMVDLEDVRAKAWIKSEHMLHCLLELFHVPLVAAVAIQRLFIDHLRIALHRLGQHRVRREGDDLFDDEAKLSVSIAAPSTTSSLVHVGINLSSRNTPVLTKGLDDYGISVSQVLATAVPAFIAEYEDLHRAVFKVREL